MLGHEGIMRNGNQSGVAGGPRSRIVTSNCLLHLQLAAQCHPVRMAMAKEVGQRPAWGIRAQVRSQLLVHPTRAAEYLLENVVFESLHEKDIIRRDALFRAHLVDDSRLGLSSDHESGA